MNEFRYHNPVRLLFGHGHIARLAREIPPDARILLTYGGGSIKANGVYDQVRSALAGRTIREFGGIGANPQYDTLMRAVEVVREEELDFLLAVGGGSVLDGTKFIAAAAPFAGDPWTLVEGAHFSRALPLGAVLTLPATGSEMNPYAVVSRRSSGQKLGFGGEPLFPRFSVLDPTTTFSLPPRQIGNGLVDAFVHTTEQYLTYPAAAPLQDRMAEAILQTLIEVGPKTLAEPHDYDARSTFMWCATNALNGLIGVGVPQDWASHGIGHSLTVLYGLDHGQSLAVVLPALLEEQRETKREKLLQYAERVWGLTDGESSQRLEGAIARTRAFFESLGVATRLSAYGVSPDAPGRVAQHLAAQGPVTLGERGDLDAAGVERLLLRAW